MLTKLQYIFHILTILASILGMYIAIRTGTNWSWQLSTLIWCTMSLGSTIELENCKNDRK